MSKTKMRQKSQSLNVMPLTRTRKVHKLTAGDLTHPDVVEDSLELQRLVLSLHGSRVQTIAAINELNDVTGGAAYCQVVLWAQILQGLHQTPLSRHRQDHRNVTFVTNTLPKMTLYVMISKCPLSRNKSKTTWNPAKTLLLFNVVFDFKCYVFGFLTVLTFFRQRDLWINQKSIA